MTINSTDSTHPDLIALSDLLHKLATEDDQPITWGHTWILEAGEVTLDLEVVPSKLTEVERDKILSFAARMTNGFIHVS